MTRAAAALGALLLLLVSCDKDPEGGGLSAPTLSVTAPKTQVLAQGESFFLNVKATGRWTARLEYADGEGWASLSPYLGNGDASVVFTAKIHSGEAGRSVTAIFSLANEDDVDDVALTITQLGVGATPPPAPTAGWLELPETPAGDGFTFGAHDMSGEVYKSFAVSGVRNWSCYWSATEHLSLWVAYPLNNALKGSGSRTNTWGVFDPCFPQSEQPDLSTTYGGGWTRGHQIPSADRLNSLANKSTFYPTNMTPQDYDFNAEIWANLEAAVRRYSAPASSDTLYVVTGCDIKGSTSTSGGNTGFRVKVPVGYWKAVLSYQKSRSSQNGGYKSCAFYLPHTSAISDGNYADYRMSVDALEQKIGIDLFVNLPGIVGQATADKIEALTPDPSFWN